MFLPDYKKPSILHEIYGRFMVSKHIRLLGLRHIPMWKTEPTDKNPRLMLYKLAIRYTGTVCVKCHFLSEAVINVRSRHDMEASLWNDVKFPRPMDIVPGSWHAIDFNFDPDYSRSVLYVSPNLRYVLYVIPYLIPANRFNNARSFYFSSTE
jgi:hypothetical protein